MSSSYRRTLLGSGSNIKGWILEYNPSFANLNNTTQIKSGDGTDDGNLFFGISSGTTAEGAAIVKINKDGDVLLEKKLGATAGNFQILVGITMDVDSSDNVFIASRVPRPSNGSKYNLNISKLNSSLVLQQINNFNTVSGSIDQATPMAVVGTDCYVGVNCGDLPLSQRAVAVKINTSNLSATSVFRSFNGAGEGPQCVHIDSNGQAYIGGEFRGSISGFAFSPITTTISTNFTRTTNQINSTTVQGGNCRDITTDSSNNIYVCGYQSSTPTSAGKNTFMKFNSTGTLQWSRTFSCPSSPNFFNGDGAVNLVSLQIIDAGLVSIFYGQSNSKSDIYVNLHNPSTGAIISSYKVTNTTSSWNRSDSRFQPHVFATEEFVYIQTAAGVTNNWKTYVLKLPIENAATVFGSYVIGGQTIVISNGGGSTTALTHTFDAQGAGTGATQSFPDQAQTFFATTALSNNSQLLEL